MQNKIKSIIKKLTRSGFRVESGDSGRVDPVCNMHASSDVFKESHKGKDYFFCSDHCRKRFQANPDDYAKL